MKPIHSRVNEQGDVSVPVEVCRRLGLGPGSFLEWHKVGDVIVVCRGRSSTLDAVHRALFPEGKPKVHTIRELKAGIRKEVGRRRKLK